MFKSLRLISIAEKIAEAITRRRISDYFQLIGLIVALILCLSPLSLLFFNPQNTQAQSRADPRLDQQQQQIKEIKEEQKSQAADFNAMEKRMVAVEVEIGVLSKVIWGSMSAVGVLILTKLGDWFLIAFRREPKK